MVIISILMEKMQSLFSISVLFLPFSLAPPQPTLLVFPEHLETAEAPLIDVLTGRYGQTVRGGSLSSRQLLYVWDWSLLSLLSFRSSLENMAGCELVKVYNI